MSFKHHALAGVVGGALLLATTSHAHLGGAEGLVPFVQDGALVGAGTTWGLVARGDDGAFSQTCEESIGDVPVGFVHRTGQTLAATTLGVMTTADDGCTWTAVPGTEGRRITALVASTTTPETIWATTATATDTSTETDVDDNGVLVSRDGGATFAMFHPVGPGVLLTSLAVGVASDGLERLLVAGVDTATRLPVLLTGTSLLTAVPTDARPLADAQLVRSLAVDDDALWFSTLDRIGRGHLFRVPVVDNGDVEGAAAVDGAVDGAVEVGSFDGLIKAAAEVAGFRFVIAAGGVVFRARATDLEAAVVEQSVWTRTVHGPLQCLQQVPGDERLWGCATRTAGTWFKATADGDTWQDMLLFADVAEHACPSETPGAALCAYALPEPPSDPAVTPPPAPSCRESGAAHSVFFGVALLLLRRRGQRRRRR